MNILGTTSWVTIAAAFLALVPSPGRSAYDPYETKTPLAMEDELLAKLIGKWEGESRTWGEPGKLADESSVSGEFVPLLGGGFVRHVYEGTYQGNPRRGQELIAFNSITELFEISWIDDVHMSYGIMFSRGAATVNGFHVRGQYDVGEGQQPWGWRTEYELTDDDHLNITAYNIHPEGMEAKAIEVTYRRLGQ